MAKDGLVMKQGRSAQFKNEAERDAYLTAEIAQCQATVADRSRAMKASDAEIQESRNVLQTLESECHALTAKKESLAASMLEAEVGMDESVRKRDKLSEERKTLWREESRIDASLPSLQSELDSLNRHLYGSLDRHVSSGLQNARRICAQYNIQGVHGPVYELFKVDPIYSTAVEAIAGNSLFHIVVDSDLTAARILDFMSKENSGRLTFMPMNRLKMKKYDNYPKDQNIAVPMISILQFEPQFEVVFQQVRAHCLKRKNVSTRAHVC